MSRKPKDTIVYSLRLNRQIKDALQNYFEAYDSDLSSGLRKMITDGFQELGIGLDGKPYATDRKMERPEQTVPSRDDQPAALVSGTAATGDIDTYLRDFLFLVQERLNGISDELERFTVSPTRFLSFGEYMKSLPASNNHVAIFTGEGGSALMMMEMSPSFFDGLKNGKRNDVGKILKESFDEIEFMTSSGESAYRLIHLEENLDYCRCFVYAEPVILKSLSFFFRGRPALLSFVMPVYTFRTVRRTERSAPFKEPS